ncbi:MAG: FixH family protein [Rhodospirillales bacterium]|nr:FixH family protein [Rhodospirillales bacterium]
MPVQRSVWRFFPWAVVGAFVVVFAVNGGMVWAALSTFPGIAATDAFDHSNHYDEVLAAAARQATLGWRVEAGTEAGRATLALTDRAGQPLVGAAIAATARRPVGPDQTTPLGFHEVAPGRYLADAALPDPGQWELRLAVTRGGATLHAAPRVVVR